MTTQTPILDWDAQTVTWNGRAWPVSNQAVTVDPVMHALRTTATAYETMRGAAIRAAEDLAAAAVETAEGLRDRVQVSAPSANRLADLQASLAQVRELEARLTMLTSIATRVEEGI